MCIEVIYTDLKHHHPVPEVHLSAWLIYYSCLSIQPNPSIPMSDQDGISPYNTNKIASRQEFGMQKNINYRIIVDPLSNSLSHHLESCMADSRESHY